MSAEITSALLMIIGGVTIPTNIIVQVVKTTTQDKFPTNFLALMVPEALILAAGIAHAQIKGITITRYLVFAIVMIRLLSVYAVMVGYDKSVETSKNQPKKTE